MFDKKLCEAFGNSFLTVGHNAIWLAYRSLWIPEQIIEYYSKFYDTSSTKLVLGDAYNLFRWKNTLKLL